MCFPVNKPSTGHTGDLCVSDIMPFWRSRPSGSDIGLCTLRPASLCPHAVGEFWSWPLTSRLTCSGSLVPVIFFVQMLRSISLIKQSHAFVSLWMMAGGSHKVLANLFDVGYMIECTKFPTLLLFERGKMEDILYFFFHRWKEHHEGINKVNKTN